ncbi:MAG: DUF3553 domain-containing protein [Alphaproteobacteria bacterium]|nr:DUF3553 domain-containing protein [Alphaproteobacteria bacterium]
MPLELVPGAWVRLKDAPDWGSGQIQSVIGNRVTINFEHAGKRLVDSAIAVLEQSHAPDHESNHFTTRSRA